MEDLDFAGNVNYWADRWAQEKIGWHKSDINRQLIANLPKLSGGVSKTFFIPLCGKTVDVPYLYSQGHRVFGVEAVPQAIEELNEEHKLGLKFDTGSSTYSTDDGRIIIYCGDIFTCPFEKYGPFDCVWDRGSFIAFEFSFRSAYAQMMQRSLKVKKEGATEEYHHFKYLMETLHYDREKFSGPPRAVDANDMNAFFGSWADIKIINREPETFRAAPDLKAEIVHYFLTPKH